MALIRLNVKDEFDGMRLDRFVLNNTECSKGAVQKLIRKGDVKVNKKRSEASVRVKSGDVVDVYNAAPKSAAKFVEGLPLPKVIYEDDFILAVNKPAGLNTQPGGSSADCLSERVKLYLKDVVEEYGGAFVPAPANRLDNGTSGIVLCGKTPKAAAELSALIRENKVKKCYFVLVCGKLNERVRLDGFARKDAKRNMMLPCDANEQGAVKMSAVYEPLETFGEYTLVKAKLITGKTHQIRFQLSAAGHEVVGDNKYGNRRINEEFKNKYGFCRLFLHCCEMSFKMWDDSGSMKITCALPEDMQNILKDIGFSLNMFEVGLENI